jgi:hypothetical protein
MLAEQKIGHFLEFFEGDPTFLTISGQKSLETLENHLEMGDYVFCQQKNNLPHFQYQRYINS